MAERRYAVLRMSERRWLVAEQSVSGEYCNVLGECGDMDGARDTVGALGEFWVGMDWYLFMLSERMWVVGRMHGQHVTPLVTCRTKYTAERVFRSLMSK